MIELINDELGTNIEPMYIENPLEEYVHDTMADYTKLYEETGWEPKIAFEEGVSRVCEPYR
jgi:UDP-glucose 4-epimerase